MKAALYFCIFMLVVLTALPASAQLVLYDDFQGNVINPDKWSGNSSDTGVNLLEVGRLILVDPIFGLKWLDIFSRGYASQDSGDTGNSSANNRLFFDDGTGITTIQATVMIRKVKSTACNANTTPTNPQVRIGGMYFNTGIATPGDQTNDVRAFITVGRRSNSSNPKNVLDISGVVQLCNDANCTTNTQIGTTVDVGFAIVNVPVKVRITWDSDNNRFIFQKGKDPERYVDYTEPDGGAPGAARGGNKRLEVNLQIPNCSPTNPRPMAYMDAYFDNIKIERKIP